MWYYQGQEMNTLPPDVVGFVYIITNNLTGRQYIGKKLAKFSKTKIRTVRLKNGTKKKKKIRGQIPSDWLTYYGSSDELLTDIQTLGKEHFTREILRLCYSRGECSYFETYYILIHHALLSGKYYNQWFSCKIHRKHLLDIPPIV